MAGGAVPLSGLAAKQNAQELARFMMSQSATSAFAQVAMQQRMRGVQVERTDLPFLEDGYITNISKEVAESEVFTNNQRLQGMLGTGTECVNADKSKFDACQAFRLNGSKDKKGKKTSHRSYNNRLDLSLDDSDSNSDDDDLAEAIKQSRAEAEACSTVDQARKKPPIYSEKDQVKSLSHVAPTNLQEPLGISGVAMALFGGPVPSYDGRVAPAPADNVARKPPARISPPNANPVPYIPPRAQFVSPASSNNAGRLVGKRSLEARVVARSMKTASRRFEGLYNVDEPGMGWQPVDDKDAKRAKKRLKHMSENPQIVAIVLDNYTENVPVPDSQEAIVIYDESTDQWDD